MKMCTETITVFNARFDKDTDRDVYYGTTIRGVSWRSEIVSTVTDSGLKAANRFTVRIPAAADTSGMRYVSPARYGAEGEGGCFTLRTGDIIIRGTPGCYLNRDGIISEIAMDGRCAVFSSAQPLTWYAESFTVVGVTDNTRAPHEPHWKVVGA